MSGLEQLNSASVEEQAQGVEIGKLEKLIRANKLRRTRFHTERGDVLPLRAVPDALASIRHRLTKGPVSEAPWMAPAAARALDHALSPGISHVLELGSGSSTIWLAARARTVSSWEAKPEWAAEVRTLLASRGVANASVRDVAIDDTPSALKQLEPEQFDVVIVDCLESESVKRTDCAAAAAPLVRPGGCLVLDDSDRVHLRVAAQLLKGWREERHIGMKPFPLMAIETTLFYRPALSRPR